VQVETRIDQRLERAQCTAARAAKALLVQDQQDPVRESVGKVERPLVVRLRRRHEGSYSSAPMTRPAVSVVVPFAGEREAAARVVAGFRGLVLGDRDELIVGDNSGAGVFGDIELPSRWRSVAALGEGSPARARNAGGKAASGEWILFVDSDCVPQPDLLDAYFAQPPREGVGIVAGRITALRGQSSAAAQYAASREHLDQRIGLDRPRWRWAHTANLLVRASLWRQLGGFLEGVRVAEDVDFCWRVEQAGWRIDYNESAAVEHTHRDTFSDLWRQAVTAGASEHWVHRRWPDAPRPGSRRPAHVARAAIAAPLFLLSGQARRALFKVWDGALALAPLAARLESNRPGPGPGTPPATEVELWTETYPDAAVAQEVRSLGDVVEVVAARRPPQGAIAGDRRPVRYLEDYTPLERARAAARLTLRHPLACLAARRDRARAHSLFELAPAIVELERSRRHAVAAADGGPLSTDLARAMRIVG
jgi:hypothetical protein